jgi:hypothetical protein
MLIASSLPQPATPSRSLRLIERSVLYYIFHPTTHQWELQMQTWETNYINHFDNSVYNFMVSCEVAYRKAEDSV